MAKLFITLYLMVIASFGVFAFYIGTINILGESIGDGALIDERVSKGTFILLNESLDGLNEQQTHHLLQQYKTLFGDEFKLAELSSINLNKEQLQQLDNGKVVTINEPNAHLVNDILPLRYNEEDEELSILYFKRPHSSQVWRLHLDYNLGLTINTSGLSVTVTGGSLSKGMMLLLQNKLRLVKQEDWSNFLSKFQESFGLPLHLKDLNIIIKDLEQNEKDNLLSNKIVNITQGTNYSAFAKNIPNTNNALVIGPIEIPWYIRNSPLLFIASFILAFATTLSLWLWPFWSNLVKIRKAAIDFGAGNYDTRIPNKWWSPVANISKAFNAMAEQTQNSIRQQKELTSAVSHELRTPVARMRFALEMLDSSEDKDDKGRFIKDINEDIDELDLLLEELLTYARFDQKNYNINPSLEKLIPWLSVSIEKLMPLAEDNILHYRVEGIGINETSLFEPRLMTRVLDNLVQNALRYASHTVEVTLCKDHDHYLLIVEDDGNGISKDKRKHIFDAFSRIDASRDRASGGFGLGLAIVDRIVKAHFGRVTVHDSPLGGARFEVRIPAKTSQ